MGKHAVPLVFYSRDGERHVVGEAEVDKDPISQEMRVIGKLNTNCSDIVEGMYSIGFDDVE